MENYSDRVPVIVEKFEKSDIPDVDKKEYHVPTDFVPEKTEEVVDDPQQSKKKARVLCVPLDKKLDMLWSFIRTHLNSKILVLLSTYKQVRFVYEAFKKLSREIPFYCIHRRTKQFRRTCILQQFVKQPSVLFSTDVFLRGLDSNRRADFVVQVDCPDDVAGYIRRVCHARNGSARRSVLFLLPSEMKMLKRMQDNKIPVWLCKANEIHLQSVSALLAKYSDLHPLAQRAFKTYVKSIYQKKDKEVFDVEKLPIDDYSASLGLPMTPQLRYLGRKNLGKKRPAESEVDETLDLLHIKETADGEEGNAIAVDSLLPTRVLKKKKKKLKINVHRPTGTRVVFDDEGNKMQPLAALGDTRADSALLDKGKVLKRYEGLREDMKTCDKEDRKLARRRRKKKRAKEKDRRKRKRDAANADFSESDKDSRNVKRNKVYFDGDNDNESKEKVALKTDAIFLEEQVKLACKILGDSAKLQMPSK